MKIDILTIFPEIFDEFKNWSIIGRARESNIFTLDAVDIRDYSKNKHKKVDDYPFGGGPGMIMTPEPIYDAIMDRKNEKSKIIFLSPQGKKYNQEIAKNLAKEEHLILLCGHYEGIDNRIIDNYIDEEISIGDYVLTGGEIPAMVLVESVVRLLPEVLGQEESFKDESHYKTLLEHSQYTRPREFKGLDVPEVLLSGNHKKIEEWKEVSSLRNTLIKRPDLLEKYEFTKEELEIIKKLKKEIK